MNAGILIKVPKLKLKAKINDMKTETYWFLEDIIKKHNESETGKILQCLLALSFYHLLKCKPEHISINLVEGVDIVIDYDDFKYAIEVKTTSRNNINMGEKDFYGLEKYNEKGYIPIVCVLKINLFSEWLLISPKRLKRKLTWNVEELFTDDEFKNLGVNLNNIFEELLDEYAFQIKDGGLGYLLKILKKENIKYSVK